MTVVLVVGAIAVVVAIVVGATWHRSADERQSVKNYQHTLETLRLVSDRNAGRHLNVTASSEGASQDLSESEALIGRSGAPQARSAVGVAAGREAGGRKTLVFGDDAGRRLPGTPAETVSELASGGPLYRQRRPAHAGIALRPGRRGLLTAFAAAVVVAAAVSTVVVGTSGSTRRPDASAGRSISSHRSRPSTGARSSSPARGSSGANRTVQPTASSTTAASYPAPTGAYTVGISASRTLLGHGHGRRHGPSALDGHAPGRRPAADPGHGEPAREDRSRLRRRGRARRIARGAPGGARLAVRPDVRSNLTPGAIEGTSTARSTGPG